VTRRADRRPVPARMFISLLAVTFAVAAFASFVVALVFRRPVAAILHRIVADELSAAWQRYLTFAIYVVGISGGVRIWMLEQYVTPRARDQPVVALNADRWTLEVYRAVIGTLQSLAWMLLVFFVFALVAYVVVRGQELKHGRRADVQRDVAGEP
jgi:hypothetical protein